MTTTPYSAARDEFHSDLGRIDDLLRLVKLFREFGTAATPEGVLDGTINWPAATALTGAAPMVRTDLPLLAGSLLLYACGRFEYFVREVVVAVADELAANAKSYTELPDRFRSELQKRTLEVSLNPRKYGYSDSEAESQLILHAQNLAGTTTVASVEIASRVLSITESNMNQRMLADVFRRVSISDIWNDLGKQAALKSFLGKASDKECTAEATRRLDELMRERNNIAHPSGSSSFPAPDQVLESTSFLRTLSAVLVEVAQVPRA